MKRTAVIVVLVVAICFVLTDLRVMAEDGPGQPPPARKIPGITADDMFVNACVDCHINMPERNMDKRISTAMKMLNDGAAPRLMELIKPIAPSGKALSGKHPVLSGPYENIPASCVACHSKTSSIAPPFGQMMHVIHLDTNEANHFMTIFQGECTHCHKLNRTTGEWRVPSGAEK